MSTCAGGKNAQNFATESISNPKCEKTVLDMRDTQQLTLLFAPFFLKEGAAEVSARTRLHTHRYLHDQNHTLKPYTLYHTPRLEHTTRLPNYRHYKLTHMRGVSLSSQTTSRIFFSSPSSKEQPRRKLLPSVPHGRRMQGEHGLRGRMDATRT